MSSGFVCEGNISQRQRRVIEVANRDEAANEWRKIYGKDPFDVGGHYVNGRCECGCDRVIWYGDSWCELHNGDIRPHRFLADHVLIAGPKRDS